MFTFFGVMNRRQFILAASVRLTLFIAGILSFPYLFRALHAASGCEYVDSECGPMDDILLGMTLMSFIPLVFILSFIGIGVRRTRDIGLPAWLGLAIPVLLALDMTFPMSGSARWLSVFTTGASGLPFPLFAVAALLLTILLCTWPSRPMQSDDPRLNNTGPISSLVPSPTIIGILFLLALVLTIVAARWALGNRMVLILQPLAPTIALNFLALWAVYCVIAIRSAYSFVLLAIALVPFGHWGYQSCAIGQQHQQEAAEVAAIPTKKVKELPSTIVVEARRRVPEIWSIGAIERLLTKTARGTYEQTLRPAPNEGRRERHPELIAPPQEHLLLRIGTSSGFSAPGKTYVADGPLELRLVGPDRDDLLAVDYRVLNNPLVPWPLLRSRGWMRQLNAIDPSKTVTAFLKRAIDADSAP